MAKQKLTNWIKTGYPYIKEGAKLPAWVLPENGLNRMVDQVGDNGILETSQPLGLTDRMEKLLSKTPDPESVPSPEWQEAVTRWPHLSQIRPLIEAFWEVSGPLTAHLPAIKSRIDPMVIYRSMAVLLFAPFVEQGKVLMEELAEILCTPANNAAGLIRSYAVAVRDSNINTLEKVNLCIVKYSIWQQWASAMQKQVLDCQHTPKLIAVTPAYSDNLIGLLATMMKEGQHGYSGDNPGCSGDQVTAQ
ncbi:hypothetical protein ACFLXC_01010 [Chloroflexota bacterium]